MNKLDCCGLSCPQPVLETKELIEKCPDELIEVTVDNEASKENVLRFLKSQSWETKVSSGEDESTFILSAAPGHCHMVFDTNLQNESEGVATKKVMFLISSEAMGKGSDELGLKLMSNFIMTLKEMGPLLWRLIFLNSGVKLTMEGSSTLPFLEGLEKEGVSILVCGTCLDFYNLMGKNRVGTVTNMLDIVTSMEVADRVIHI